VSRDYELGLIINPEVSEEETRAVLDRVEQIVANYGGQIVRVNQWGRRRLAYPIERHRDGFYIFVDMILTPETVSELERTLKVSETVLRHMTKKRDPKAVQKEREEREARAAAAAASAQESEAAAAATQEQAPVATEATEAPKEETPTVSEAAVPDTEDVPPAIEETIEA
jgi:small subunit ribosomal protein S6